MRTFAAQFTTEKNKEQTPFFFWTAAFRFSQLPNSNRPDLYLSDQDITIGGNVHEAIVTSWGDLGSARLRSETSLEIPEIQITTDNGPSLSTGERFSDYFFRDFESCRVDFYLNAKVGATVYQEQIFAGFANAPTRYDYLVCQVTVVPMTERYLNKDVLRLIREDDFPFARPSEVGQYIPQALGSCRVTGRVLKAGFVTTPVAGDANVGDAALSRVRLTRYTSLTDGTYTVTFSSATAYVVSNGEGSGDITTDFSADSGQFELLAEDWSGTPTSGDTFSFEIDSAPPMVVFSESPVGWPIASIGDLYWDGHRFDTTTVYNAGTAVESMTIEPSGRMIGNLSIYPGSGLRNTANFLADYPDPIIIAQPIVPVDWRHDTMDAFEIGITTTATSSDQHYFFAYWYPDLRLPDTANGTNPLVGPVISHPVWGPALYGLMLLPNAHFVHSGAHYLVVSSTANTANGKLAIWGCFDTGLPHAMRYDRGAGAWVSLGWTMYYRIVAARGAQVNCAIPAQKILFGSQQPKLVAKIRGKWAKDHLQSQPLTVGLYDTLHTFPDGEPIAVRKIKAADVSLSCAGESIPPIPRDYDLEEMTLLEGGGVWVRSDSDDNPTGVWDAACSSFIEDAHHIDATTDVTSEFPQAVAHGGSWGYWRPYQRLDGTPMSLNLGVVGATVTRYASADDGTGNLVAMVTFDGPIPDKVTIEADLVRGSAPCDQTVRKLLNQAGYADADIDLAGSFAASGALYGSTYRFDGVIDTQRNYKRLIIDLARQCRSIFDWSTNKAKLFFIPTTGTPIKTLTLDDVVTSPGQPFSGLEFARTDPADLLNYLNLRWNRDFAKDRGEEAYADLSVTLNQPSIDVFGKKTQDDLFMCDFVRSSAMAADLGVFWPAYRGFPKRTALLTTWFKHLELEPTDIIGLNLDPSAIITPPPVGFGLGGFGEGGFGGVTTFDGLSGNQPFLVEGLRILCEDRKLEIIAQEL